MVPEYLFKAMSLSRFDPICKANTKANVKFYQLILTSQIICPSLIPNGKMKYRMSFSKILDEAVQKPTKLNWWNNQNNGKVDLKLVISI